MAVAAIQESLTGIRLPSSRNNANLSAVQAPATWRSTGSGPSSSARVRVSREIVGGVGNQLGELVGQSRISEGTLQALLEPLPWD